jgi:hypothetical protein
MPPSTGPCIAKVKSFGEKKGRSYSKRCRSIMFDYLFCAVNHKSSTLCVLINALFNWINSLSVSQILIKMGRDL